MSRIDRKYIEKLRQLQDDTDEEKTHILADKILCDLLTELTYTDIVDEYNKVGKWYA